MPFVAYVITNEATSFLYGYATSILLSLLPAVKPGVSLQAPVEYSNLVFNNFEALNLYSYFVYFNPLTGVW